MKNALLTLLFIVILGQASHFGLPWWSAAPIAAIAGWLFPQTALRSFLIGFLAGFLLWLIAALMQDVSNAGILSTKIGNLFMGISRWTVLLLTGVLAGILAGLGCLTGRWARDLVFAPAR